MQLVLQRVLRELSHTRLSVAYAMHGAVRDFAPNLPMRASSGFQLPVPKLLARRLAMFGGCAIAISLAAIAAWSLRRGSPTPPQAQSPATSSTASQGVVPPEFEEWRVLSESAYEADTPDVPSLARLLSYSERYEAVAEDVSELDSLFFSRLMAGSSLAIVARAWHVHGPIPELRDRALTSAVRLSVGEDTTLRVCCAGVLHAVRESDGPDSLTGEQQRTLDELLRQPDVKHALDRMLFAWQEERGE